jgi:hypothetical protein
MLIRSEQKIDQTYLFFQQIKDRLEATAIIKIVYYWRRFVKKKKIKRMKAAEKALASEKKFGHLRKKDSTKKGSTLSVGLGLKGKASTLSANKPVAAPASKKPTPGEIKTPLKIDDLDSQENSGPEEIR